MTSPHTLPITRPASNRTPAPLPEQAHEHSWITDSRHSTSDGMIVYVHCTDCRAHRVDLQAHPTLPPAALSRAAAATVTTAARELPVTTTAATAAAATATTVTRAATDLPA